MKSTPQKPRSISFWRPTSPRLDEFINLLELLHVPAILYDVPHDKILGANSKLLRFSAYSRTEITKLSLQKILPDISPLELLGDQVKPIVEVESCVTIRNGQQIPSFIQVTLLNPNLNWLIILIETQAQRQQQQIQSQRQFNLLHTLDQISLTDFSTNNQDLLDIITKYGCMITGSSIMAIYKLVPESNIYEGDKFIQISIFGDGTVFPNIIESQDISQLSEPYLWQPGKRISVELHRLARKYQLSYLAYAPIRNNQNLFGILIAADTQNYIDDQILPYLNTLSNIVAARIRNWSSINKLETEYQENQEAFTIYQKVMDNVQDGIILLSPSMEITEINPSCEQILGYANREIQGQPVENVLIGAPNLHFSLQAATEGVETPTIGNINLHRRDGQSFAAHLQIIPVLKNKAVSGIIILLRDLSKHHEIKIRTQQLEQRALLGELTAIFAHEIRNPINNMSLAIQLMELETSKEDPNFVHIDRLKQNRDRLTHLMDTVLSFSRSTNYQMVPIDIVSVIDKVIVRWQPNMIREKVESHLHKTGEIPMVNGNAHALEQIFNNLFSNAIRAMHETNGGILNIKLEKLRDPAGQMMIQINVSDTGPGIPQEHLTHIFQPFFTTDKDNGTGLGLAITQRIIIAHKGKIQVESFPGGGTVFHIQLPAVHPQ